MELETTSALAACVPTRTATSASSSAGRHQSMIVPDRRTLMALMDAIEAPMCPDDRKGVIFVTCWGCDALPEQPYEHQAYVAHMRKLMDVHAPWLIPLLDAARGGLQVAPGVCFFGVHNHIGVRFDLPTLVPYTYFLPWPTEADLKSVQ